MTDWMESARRRLEDHLRVEVSSRSLAMIRVFATYAIYAQFASPWVAHRVDDIPGAFFVTWVVFGSAAFVVLGFKTRIATAVMATAFGVLHFYYGIHLGLSPSYEIDPGQVIGARPFSETVQEFQLLFLLAVTPCGRSLSIDRALEVRRARAEGRQPPPERMPWWQLELFVILTASMYLWIGYDCLSNENWLSGAQLEYDFVRFWARSDMFVASPWASQLAVAVAWTAMLICFVLAFGLLSRRLRPTLLWAGVALQLAVLFNFIESWAPEYHNLLMLATLIACLDPQRVHDFITLQGVAGAEPPAPRIRTKLEAISLTRISSRSLGLFRIFAAYTMLIEFTSTWTGPRVDEQLGALVLSWVMLIGMWFVLVGYKTRWATACVAIAVAILHLYYGVHFKNYLLYKPVVMFQAVVLMALAPCGRSFSIDRAIEVRRARAEGREPEPESVPWWIVELFILQIASMYLWAAYNKSDGAWLRGERMERYWLEWYGTSDSLAYSPLVHVGAVFFAWSSTIVEYVLAFGLLSRRTRPYVMFGGIMLHVGILLAFAVTYFSLKMLTLLSLCLRPQLVHDFVGWITADSNTETA